MSQPETKIIERRWTMSDLKIVGLKVNGFQKLSAVEMEFPTDGGCIYIRGGNEQGKTSVIDCLWWLFSGKTIINSEKIQHGKEKITGLVDLGDFTIERIERKNGKPKLEIKRSDGFSITDKKEAFLDRLTNDLTFNPFPFLNLSAEKKLKFMMDFLKIDFSEIDQKIADQEQERLYIGRDIKSIGEVKDLIKVDPVDVKALLEEKNRIQAEIEAELEEIREYNQLQKDRDYDKKNAKLNIEYWANQIEEIQEELKKAVERHGGAEEKLKSLPDPKPIKKETANQTTTEIDLDILRADNINRDHENWKRDEEKRIQKEMKEKEYKKLTQEIESLRQSKKEKLSITNTGVNGLEIKETGLYYKGTFIENCSDSEKLKISMQLCRSMNPPLKAVFLDRGESFDATRIAEIEKFAEENDIQVFITQVADDIPEEIPSNVFYIVEGEVKK
jgi:DNA-binding XRE family transcriptional regulator